MSTPEKNAAFQADPTDPRHGTMNGYNNLKCRCLRCKEAWRIYPNNQMHNRKYRARLAAEGFVTGDRRRPRKQPFTPHYNQRTHGGFGVDQHDIERARQNMEKQ